MQFPELLGGKEIYKWIASYTTESLALYLAVATWEASLGCGSLLGYIAH